MPKIAAAAAAAFAMIAACGASHASTLILEPGAYASFTDAWDAVYLDFYAWTLPGGEVNGRFEVDYSYDILVYSCNPYLDYCDNEIVNVAGSGLFTATPQKQFLEVAVPTTFAGFNSSLIFQNWSNARIVLDLPFYIPRPVPEPASWGLMLTGLFLVGGAMRDRRKVAVSFA